MSPQATARRRILLLKLQLPAAMHPAARPGPCASAPLPADCQSARPSAAESVCVQSTQQFIGGHFHELALEALKPLADEVANGGQIAEVADGDQHAFLG